VHLSPRRLLILACALAFSQTMRMDMAHATQDDLCPRLEGIDLQCAPVFPPPGGGGGGGGGGAGCPPVPCEPGYDCVVVPGPPGVGDTPCPPSICPPTPGDGGTGGGNGSGSGTGSGTGPVSGPATGPVTCKDETTQCYYVKDGTVQTMERTSTTAKITAYKIVFTSQGPELPDACCVKSTTSSCTNVTGAFTCYKVGDSKSLPGTINSCTGVRTCPAADPGWSQVTSVNQCPASTTKPPLCSTFTTPDKPICPGMTSSSTKDCP